MLKFIPILFFLCLINKCLATDNALYKFAASLDDESLEIYNDQGFEKTITLEEVSYSIDFDKEKNLLIGSSKNKKVFTWNISTQSTVNWSQNEAEETRAIAFLNKTHFIAGFRGFFVIYDCSNLNSKLKISDSSNIGEVYDIKILIDDLKILIASKEGFISVFNLINYNFLKKNQIANEIRAIDVFDQNLIVSQCNDDDVCFYKLDSSNDLQELKKYSGDKDIFAIKILNENKVVFGGDQLLIIWDISTNSINSISLNTKVLSLDIFSEEIIASGHEDGKVKFWNMTNYNIFKTIDTKSKVHSLKNLNGYSAIKNFLNLKSNQHSTQQPNLESTSSTFINMQTTHESTEQKLTTSNPSSINTLMPTAIDTVAETITKLIQTTTETVQPSEYLSPSSTFFQIFTTINHENQILPTESSYFEYFTDTLKNTDTMSSNLYSEKQLEITNKELESTTLNKEKTTIESTIFESSETASSHSEQQSDSTSKEFDLSTSYIKMTTIESTFLDSTTKPSSTSQELSTFTWKEIQSSSSETNSILTTNIQQQPKEDFSFSNLLPSELVEVLKKNYDMNDCLNNCSGNGMCKFKDKSLFVCECFNNFAGSSCQINTLPCASNPCLNNATCVNNFANKTFTCHCQLDNNRNDLYFGKNCQNKVDVCANETCSKNGVCYDVNDKAKCKCFLSYSGEKCQIESDESKTRKMIIKTSTIIAIIVLVLFFLILILNDLSSLFCKKKTQKKRCVVQKLVYIN